MLPRSGLVREIFASSSVNFYYSRGVLAKSNTQLVERLVRCVRDLGLEVASPDQARQMLGMPKLKDRAAKAA